MDRELTVNLRVVGPAGGELRTASDAVKRLADASTVATTAQQSLANAARTASSAAQTAAEQHGRVALAVANSAAAMGRATVANREYATSMERLDQMSDEFERGLRDLNQQLDRMESDRRKLAAADREYLEGVQRLVGGVTSLARSMVLLTAANEEDSAEMLRMIARFESVGQAVNGVIGVVQGATKAWQQYATAASLAGNAATVGGFLGRTGGYGLAIAGAAVGSGAIMAGGALAAEGVSDYFTGDRNSTTGGWLASGMTNLYGMQIGPELPYRFLLTKPYEDAAWSQRNLDRMLADRQTRTAMLTDRERYLASQRDQQEALAGVRINNAMVGAGIGLDGGARGLVVADEGLKAVRGRLAEIGEVNERDPLEVQAGNRREILQLLEQERSLELQRNESRIVAAQEEISTARQRLSIAQQEADIARQRLGYTRTGLAGLNGGERAELSRAVEVADSGGTLNERQRLAIRRAGLRGYDDALIRSEEADIARDPRMQRIYQQQQTLSQPIEARVKAESELVIKLEQNLDAQKPVWQAEIMAFLQRQADAMVRATDENLKAQIRVVEENIRRSQIAREKQ